MFKHTYTLKETTMLVANLDWSQLGVSSRLGWLMYLPVSSPGGLPGLGPAQIHREKSEKRL